NSLHRLLAHYYKRRLSWFGQKLGYTIPINTCGHGLSLPHVGTIVINGKARIGNNCRIHVCVNIGASGGDKSAPVIGNGVYIAPGVKIYGDISIADGIAIGANAVVNKSFTQPNVTIAGLPAKVVGEGGAIAAGWNPS
ncbi:MAG: serine acetyltransferase, partial [Opitutae bacterium]|nr:serine acetyltransferase [Opitutae bacterium]